MPPQWLESVAAAAVAVGLVSAAIILAMQVVRPEKMAVMHVVWPVTGLYWVPAAPWARWRYYSANAWLLAAGLEEKM